MTNKQYVIAIDQGTTSSRVILFDEEANVVDSSQLEVKVLCSQNGWIEQNAEEIWETVYECLKSILNNFQGDFSEIKAIGITNQRETTIIWDKLTGLPVYNAIVWQSRQSQKICEELIASGFASTIKEKTGLLINPYFSGSKIKWMMDNVSLVKERISKGELLFGTVDSYLLWKLTNSKIHATDYTNASRTMLFNIHTLKWDQEILKKLEIPSCILPTVYSSNTNFGIATALKKINENINIPIMGIMGDQQASLFGQCSFALGDVKNTYGTGCFMLMNTKEKIIDSKNGLLSTIAWAIDDKVEYALEGSVFVGGSAVQWLRDGLKVIEKSKDVEKSSDVIKGSNGVYMVPAFVGLGTPYWDNDARGSVFGLTRETTKEHLINAVVESIAYQSKDVMEVMMQESNIAINTLAVDGGASSNDYLMQFQADILDCKIVRPQCMETTALGVAFIAGLKSKIWKSKEDLIKLHRVDKIFMGEISSKKIDKLYSGWKQAIKATQTFKTNKN